MKVLQIVPAISLIYGGPSQMVIGLSSALAKLGIDVTIVTTNANGDIDQTPLEVPLYQMMSDHRGYNIIYFPCSPFKRYKFSYPLLKWLAQNAHEYNIAHIHALFSPLSTAAATIARSKQLPYILRPLGTLDPADLKKKKWLKLLYGYLLERPNLQGASLVHFTSQEESKVSYRFGAKTNDIVIPLGIDFPSEIVTKPINEVPNILFLSRLDPKKGLELLIPALENLIKQGIAFNFILAGSNPQDPKYETNIKERINRSELGNRTSIMGFVTGVAKKELLQLADLFILPSYYENFGIAVVEAMSYGIPVIISKGVYIYQEIEQSQSGWISELSITGLTQTIALALSNRSIRIQKGINALNYAQDRYTWTSVAQATVQVYEQVIISQ